MLTLWIVIVYIDIQIYLYYSVVSFFRFDINFPFTSFLSKEYMIWRFTSLVSNFFCQWHFCMHFSNIWWLIVSCLWLIYKRLPIFYIHIESESPSLVSQSPWRSYLERQKNRGQLNARTSEWKLLHVINFIISATIQIKNYHHFSIDLYFLSLSFIALIPYYVK